MAPIIEKIHLSAKYRFYFGHYRRLRRRKLALAAPPESWEHSTAVPPLAFVVMAADVPLLWLSLKSIARAAPELPKLLLVGDSDDAVDALRSGTARIGAAAEVFHWRDLLDRLESAERAFVETWERSEPFGGYARKFAGTLALNSDNEILLSDADVLWRADIQPIVARRGREPGKIMIGTEHRRSYDAEVNAHLEGPDLYAESPTNCGFVYYPEGSLRQHLPPSEYPGLMPFGEEATNHLEQTLIAKVFFRSEGNFFEPDEVLVTIKDEFQVRRRENALVRHYAGAKDLFWRDVEP